MTTKNIPLWTKDYKILYQDKNYIKFFPSKDMNKIEQLNALSRFSIYLFILLILFSDNINWLFIPIFILVITIFMESNTNFESFYNQNNNMEVILDNPALIGTLKKKKTKSNKCTMPTKNNPFMNVIQSDYMNNPKRKPACNPLDEKVKKEIKKKFSNNLFQNTDSNNSNYYTMPSTTIPNQQNEFALWLYGGSNNNCKTNQRKCI